MGVLQNFERRLQGAVGNTFARLFGGSVHPSEVIGALQDEASGHLKRQGDRTIAPNHFKVRLGPTDRGGIGPDSQRVQQALADTVRDYLNEQGWDTFGEIEIEIEESSALHTGQFRVSSIVDPDSGARRPSKQGAPAMSQTPVDRSGTPYPPQQPGQQQPGQRPGYQPYPPAPPYPGYQPAAPQYPGAGQQPYPPQQPYPGQQQYPGQQPYQPYYPPPSGPQQQPDRYQQNYPEQRQPEYRESIAVLVTDDGSGRSYQLERGSNIVGRGQDAAFRLPDTAVSRQHIDVYFDGAIAVMHDLGSTNGTTVNGSSVQTWQLADGDVIRIGHSTIIFNQRG